MRGWVIVLMMLLCVLLVLPSSAVNSTILRNDTVFFGDVQVNGNQIGVTSDGRIYVVYGEKGNISSSYSDDNGNTWTMEIINRTIDSEIPDQDYADILIDGGNNVSCVYMNTTDKILYFVNRTDSWGDSYVIPLNELETPYIKKSLVNSSGYIHVIVGIPSDYIIHIVLDSQGNMKWRENITYPGYTLFGSFDFVIDKNDVEHVAIIDDATREIIYRNKTGGSWGNLIHYPRAATDVAYRVAMAIGDDNTAHIAYSLEFAGDDKIPIYYTNNSAGSFNDPPLMVNESATLNQDVHMAYDRNGYLYIVWAGQGYGDNPGTSNVYFTKNAGDGWSDVGVLTNDTLPNHVNAIMYSNYPTVGGTRTNIYESGFAILYSQEDFAFSYLRYGTYDEPVPTPPSPPSSGTCVASYMPDTPFECNLIVFVLLCGVITVILSTVAAMFIKFIADL